MSTLKEIRQHLKSIENIKKITDTMERVAAARLRQAQANAEQSRPYIAKLKEILEKVAASDVTHPLFEKREVKRTGLIVISADRGLSGSYNSNIFVAADKFLKSYAPEQVDLILLGRKAIEYYSRKKWNIRYQVTHGIENRSVHDTTIFSNQLVNWFLEGELDEIWLIYTHYVSVMHRNIVLEKFLNIGRCQVTHKETARISVSYIFEPDPIEILSAILPRYCMTRIQTALYEAYASELAARIVAMQTASKNSEEFINQLTLVKNKTRQRDITREMIEITAGAEGTK